MKSVDCKESKAFQHDEIANIPLSCSHFYFVRGGYQVQGYLANQKHLPSRTLQ